MAPLSHSFYKKLFKHCVSTPILFSVNKIWNKIKKQYLNDWKNFRTCLEIKKNSLIKTVSLIFFIVCKKISEYIKRFVSLSFKPKKQSIFKYYEIVTQTKNFDNGWLSSHFRSSWWWWHSREKKSFKISSIELETGEAECCK